MAVNPDADLRLVDRSGLHWQPGTKSVRTLLYDYHPGDIRTVIVDGNVVMHDGGIAILNEEKLIFDLRPAPDTFLRPRSQT